MQSSNLVGELKFKQLYLAKIRDLELENASLKIKNYSIITKFQSALAIIQDQISEEISTSEVDEDYALIEELHSENMKLRQMLQIGADTDSMSMIESTIQADE